MPLLNWPCDWLRKLLNWNSLARDAIRLAYMKIKSYAAVQTVILLLSLCVADASKRLAIGTLGVAPESRDAALTALLATELSSAPGIEMVERRELDAVLKEASLPLAGLVRAKDAVRFGSLLRADQFLLGTSLLVSGTNRYVIRLVDAKTGVILAVKIVPDSTNLPALAKQISEFIRGQSKGGSGQQQDYVALGVIQNLGVNNRFPDFPAQMRSSVAANLSGKVTVLERDVISFLANEVRLDIAGLTDTKPSQTPPIQFAFWIVDGFYQSYEVAEPEVQLKLRVERVQGGQQSFMLQAKPDEQLFKKMSETILKALRQPERVSAQVPPSRRGEIEALEARGKQLIDYELHGPMSLIPFAFIRPGIWIK